MSDIKGNGHPEPEGETLEIDIGAPPDESALRKLNHRVWLGQCAIIFEQQWRQSGTQPFGPPGESVQMTPFRRGLIARLRMAAEYIALLEQDDRRAKQAVRYLQKRLGETAAKLEALTKRLEDKK